MIQLITLYSLLRLDNPSAGVNVQTDTNGNPWLSVRNVTESAQDVVAASGTGTSAATTILSSIP
jgi:hypothetical protein